MFSWHYVQTQSNHMEFCVFNSKKTEIKLKSKSGLQTFWSLSFQNIQTWFKMSIWKTWNVGKISITFDSALNFEGWHTLFPCGKHKVIAVMTRHKVHRANILTRSGFSLDEKPTSKAKMWQEKLLEVEDNLSEPESQLSAGADLCTAGYSVFQM